MTPRPYFVVLGFLDANSWDPSGWERPQVPRSMDLSNILTKNDLHISPCFVKNPPLWFFRLWMLPLCRFGCGRCCMSNLQAVCGLRIWRIWLVQDGKSMEIIPEIAPLKTGEMAFPTVDFSQQDMVSGHSCEQNIRYVLGSNLLQIAKQFHHLICLDV